MNWSFNCGIKEHAIFVTARTEEDNRKKFEYFFSGSEKKDHSLKDGGMSPSRIFYFVLI